MSINIFKENFKSWFFEGQLKNKEGLSPGHHKVHLWINTMCLTGVDLFSSLGYTPGIAALAAGALAPLATLLLVALILFGVLPVYFKVAKASPNGQGSLAMLENLLPGWQGKALILCLLGFAATDFIITITLSAADATAHLVENPLLRAYHLSPVLVTLLLLVFLGGIFLLGFTEAISVSVLLVSSYLFLNLIVVFAGFKELWQHPIFVNAWITNLFTSYPNPLKIIGLAIIAFPKLALGMSGFETGVAVMPLVKGHDSDTPDNPVGRIKNTHKLLLVAAVIMSFYLITTTFITSVLIPANEFIEGGKANGRAISYLSHNLLGHGFGSLYDFVTILILWFAGASALTGLLNLVPRYLPRYGMAPEWARSIRPLVVFFTLVGVFVTLIFKANVDLQAGAYATGVLVLMTSAGLAVTLLVWSKFRQRLFFGIVTIILTYTAINNIIQRPDGLHIATFFIVAILISSLSSRALRATELRVQRVVLDNTAREFIEEAKSDVIRIVAHRPGGTNYMQKEKEVCDLHNIPPDHLIFLEVKLGDASEFSSDVFEVQGVRKGKYRVLRGKCQAVPNAIAALLLHIRDITGQRPHVYMGWTEGNPIMYILKYLFLGEGETAPVTREILRECEHEPKQRPFVHVG